jgi:PASTA domain/FG-GAP repeat
VVGDAGGSGVYVSALGSAGGTGGAVFFVTFGDDPPSRIEVGKAPGSILVEDLDGDGSDDVVATLSLSRQVAVKTVGGGLLTRNVGAAPSAAAVADLNEDGLPDIAVANRGSASVSVLLNGVGAPPGRPSCVVPRVLGRTLAAARPILTASRCTVGRVTRRWSRARRGRIVGQRPPAATRLTTGASVALVVSRGPRPRR